MICLEDFLSGVSQIAEQQPAYLLGHDGLDGYCDCIGLIKGAIRRAGGTPSGLSGTNYAARKTILGMSPIKSSSELSIGQVVLKARSPEDPGWALPDSYKPGGSRYSGDLTDYNHIGVVMSVNPLRITHMTEPTVKTDTKLGKWRFHGDLPHFKSGEVRDLGTVTVISPDGGWVNMRAGAGTNQLRVAKFKPGETLYLLEKGDTWSKCQGTDAGKLVTGWIKNDFLLFPKTGDDTVSVNREELEAVYKSIGAWLKGVKA